MHHLAKFCHNRSVHCGDTSIFQNGGHLPSWICFRQISTTDEEYFVVSITVQNLVQTPVFNEQLA